MLPLSAVGRRWKFQFLGYFVTLKRYSLPKEKKKRKKDPAYLLS